MSAEKALEQLIAEFNDEFEGQADQMRGDLEATLLGIRNYRDSKNAIERDLKEMEEPVRKWLALNQDLEGPLVDAEHGITAKLSERHGADVYSTDRMPDDLILLLHKIGALKVDSGVIKASKNEEVNDRGKGA